MHLYAPDYRESDLLSLAGKGRRVLLLCLFRGFRRLSFVWLKWVSLIDIDNFFINWELLFDAPWNWLLFFCFFFCNRNNIFKWSSVPLVSCLLFLFFFVHSFKFIYIIYDKVLLSEQTNNNLGNYISNVQINGHGHDRHQILTKNHLSLSLLVFFFLLWSQSCFFNQYTLVIILYTYIYIYYRFLYNFLRFTKTKKNVINIFYIFYHFLASRWCCSLNWKFI